MPAIIFIKTIYSIVTSLPTLLAASYRAYPELLPLDVSILTRATVVRARFLAAAFSDGSYLAHVNGAYLRTYLRHNGAYLRHVCIASPISQRGPLAYAARCQLTVPGWSKVHDGDFEGVEQTCSRIQPASPILAVM